MWFGLESRKDSYIGIYPPPYFFLTKKKHYVHNEPAPRALPAIQKYENGILYDAAHPLGSHTHPSSWVVHHGTALVIRIRLMFTGVTWYQPGTSMDNMHFLLLPAKSIPLSLDASSANTSAQLDLLLVRRTCDRPSLNRVTVHPRIGSRSESDPIERSDLTPLTFLFIIIVVIC